MNLNARFLSIHVNSVKYAMDQKLRVETGLSFVGRYKPFTRYSCFMLRLLYCVWLCCSREGESRPSRSFSFVSWYLHGVSSVVYDAAHSALIVGGAAEQTSRNGTEAAASGLTVWRVLSDAPYYKLVSDTDTIAVSLLMLSWAITWWCTVVGLLTQDWLWQCGCVGYELSA